jgi:hypothetical protein
MEWCVMRTGIKQFDMLHAYGLAVLLATACETVVKIREAAYSYILSCSACMLPQIDSDVLLERVFPLPDEEEVRLCDPHAPEQMLAITVFDGLLAALFTTPGSRALSVSDLLHKQSLDHTALQKGLRKAARKVGKWQDVTRRVTKEKKEHWLDDLLSDYHQAHPVCPILVEGSGERHINVLMTIDPSLSYSLRSPYSDGRIMERTQVTVQGTRYAGLLTYLGASRFLRGHRLSGDLANYYLPVARSCSIHAHTTLPLLLPTHQKPEQAALRQWLLLAQQTLQSETAWSSLAYQTLLTQGLQQSLSLEHGELEYAWLFSLQKRLGNGVLRFWQSQLSAKEGMQEEQEALLDCLKWRNPRAWRTHLLIKARNLIAHPDSGGRRYSLEEVRSITEIMKNSAQEPLKIVLEREEGTRRFGRALRQIGRSDPSRLRDLVEDLETARTRTQLLPVLQRIVLASELEKAKDKRIVVPTEKDLAVLLEDMDQFGIPEIVGLLLVLSALRYPRRDEHGELKVDISTMIRALAVLARYLQAIAAVSDDSATSSSPELFLDDPELAEGTDEPQEE